MDKRKTRSSLMHQNTGTSRLHQEAYITPLGEDTKKKWELITCRLQKGEPTNSKLGKMRRQRNTEQMKEQGESPPDQKKKREETVNLTKN